MRWHEQAGENGDTEELTVVHLDPFAEVQGRTPTELTWQRARRSSINGFASSKPGIPLLAPTIQLTPLGSIPMVSVLNQRGDHLRSSPVRRSNVTARLTIAGHRIKRRVACPPSSFFVLVISNLPSDFIRQYSPKDFAPNAHDAYHSNDIGNKQGL
jgi:hypothetical protein